MLNREIMSTDQYTKNWQEARHAAEEKGLRIVEHGWEQHVIIDEASGVVYRYPRHDAAAEKLADEVAVLGDVHKKDWPISLPVMREHTHVFTSYDYIPGEVLTSTRVQHLQPQDFKRIGGKLGEFVSQFHTLDYAIVEQKKTKHSTSLLEYYEDRINRATDSEFYSKAADALDRLIKQKGMAEDVVVHGDLHGPNIVINPDSRQLVGVIDLSEIEVGDPHHEFRKVFMTYPDALPHILESYESNGGQRLNAETIVLWAYVNEWANLSYFKDTPDNLTYQRARAHLAKWQQL